MSSLTCTLGEWTRRGIELFQNKLAPPRVGLHSGDIPADKLGLVFHLARDLQQVGELQELNRHHHQPIANLGVGAFQGH